MNQEIKKLWVAALRSGNYVQGKNALCQESPEGPHFCCLGVLCDLAVAADVTEQSLTEDKGNTVRAYREDLTLPNTVPATAVLPHSVVMWANLNSAHPMVLADGYEHGLAQLNDSGSTFSEIADLIEKHL